MARVLTTTDAVRARFTALGRDLVFFDGPGGTQVPDSVIDAIGDYLRTANANLDLANRNLKRAHDAVQKYFVKTSQSHLLNVPGLQTLRKQLLE